MARDLDETHMSSALFAVIREHDGDTECFIDEAGHFNIRVNGEVLYERGFSIERFNARTGWTRSLTDEGRRIFEATWEQ